MTSLESAARDWLSDPPWNKLFKNSWDVIEDQLNRGMVAVAAISLAVRFLANLPSGDLLCIVIGTNVTDLEFNSLAGPFHASLAAYASQDPGCHRAVFVNPNHAEQPGFIQYAPIIMILQAIILIGVEKIWMIFPRLSQKLERFYKSVVEEALLGKDPDVAEDFTGGATDSNKVIRERQREEICGALKGSNIFYQMYVLKNVIEFILANVFIILDWMWGLQSHDDVGVCDIPMGDKGIVNMQCRQKRYGFYYWMLTVFLILMGLHMATSLISLVWSFKMTRLRRISSIISSLKKSQDHNTQNLIESKGQDFLFLFDLVAHSCGLPATLRVLTYTAPTFAGLCQPEVKPGLADLEMDPDRIKVFWKPCPLQSIKTAKQIMIQKYVVTIFPSATSNMITTVAGKGKHEAEFTDLIGGKREYVVTISAIIGDAKMKGVSHTIFLPPHPPQNLAYAHLEDNTEGGAVKIRWSRPKGEFDRYILKVAELEVGKSRLSTDAEEEDKPIMNGRSSLHQDTVTSPSGPFGRFKVSKRTREHNEVWLGGDEVEYVKTNLKPGSRYQIELRSMTGNFSTCVEKDVPTKLILTKPLPPPKDSFSVVPYNDKLVVSWEKPQGAGHTFLEFYKVQIKNADDQVLKEVSVPRQQTNLTIESLRNNDNMINLNPEDHIISGTQYTVSVASVCKDTTNFFDKTGDLMKLVDNLVSISSFVTKTVVTPPLPPSNLKLESAAATSIKVKWDPPTYIPAQGKLTYGINIVLETPDVRQVMADDRNKEVESNVYQFSNLPVTGEKYRVTVSSVFTPVVGGSSYSSDPLTEIFTTKPLPPEKLMVKDHNERIFSWFKSPSPGVHHYKLKIKRDGEKACDYVITDPDDRSLDDPKQKQGMISFTLPTELENDVDYKINIFSMVRDGQGRDGWIESKPLSNKIVKQEEVIKTDTDLETEGDVFDAITDMTKITKITVHRTTSKAVGERPVSVLRHSVDPGDSGALFSQQSSVNENV